MSSWYVGSPRDICISGAAVGVRRIGSMADLEREMERLFGHEWKDYRKAVPRWGFRFSPYIPTIELDRGDITSHIAALGDGRAPS